MANKPWSVVSGLQDEDEAETRKGPWTVKEDFNLLDGAVAGGIKSPSSWYMVASPEDFSHNEAYFNHYSDLLWNMDKEDDNFNGSKLWVSQNNGVHMMEFVCFIHSLIAIQSNQ